MKDTEFEIRSFINESQYSSIVKKLTEQGFFSGTESQETWYFDGAKDLRIQRSDNTAKIWMKEGNIHDEARKEIELAIDRDDFGKSAELLMSLGFRIKVKWFRERKKFKQGELTICLDYTKGYGYIIEIEVMDSIDQREKCLTKLKRRLKELGIEQTPREIFETRYRDYLNNWRILIEAS